VIAPLYDTFGQPKPEGAWFDEVAASRAVRWIERNLRHYQGEWAGKPLLLMAWQVRIVRELFGWKRTDGTRLYRTTYVEAPRKSGKSTFATAIALYLAYADDEAAPQVLFAAFDRDQADVCYSIARRMVEAEPRLREATVIYNAQRKMELLDNAGGYLRSLSSEYAKQYGLNIHGLVFDELMTQRTRTLWDALTTAQGSRRQPLTFCITSAGFERESVCFEQHEHVRAIAEGDARDPYFLGVIYGAPMDADWTDEAVWQQANPSLGETTTLAYYRERFTRAKDMTTEQNAFRTLLLSQWVGQAERFLDMEAWDASGSASAPPSKRVAFGGLDLSATTDLTAFVVVAERDGALDVHPHIFIPEDGLLERERRDRVPYTTWAREGFIMATPGPVIDYGFVRQTILQAASEFDLRDVSYDRHFAAQLVQELEGEGVAMVQVPQTIAYLSSPTKELLRMTLEGRIRHGRHPVLRWCASNVAVKQDAQGNVLPDKATSTRRIDPIVALILALDGWMRRGRELKRRSVYEDRGLVIA
jgi:phage terminase large subunit-like protein